MSKKLFLLIALALLLGVSVFYVWTKSAVVAPTTSELIVTPKGVLEVPNENGARFVTDVDPDISHWQTKETEFFTIKFPKEWYWIDEAIDNRGSNTDAIITNNPYRPVWYPDDVEDKVVNNTEVVMTYSYTLAAVEDIISVGVVDMSPVEGCEFFSGAQSSPILRLCVQKFDDYQIRDYQLIYDGITISLLVMVTNDTLVSSDLVEKIVKSVVFTGIK